MEPRTIHVKTFFGGETMGERLKTTRRTCRNRLSGSGICLQAFGAWPEQAPRVRVDGLTRGLFAYDVMCLRPTLDDDLLQRMMAAE